MTPDTNPQQLSPEELAENDSLRSEFMKRLIAEADFIGSSGNSTPRVIVQFWNDAGNVPSDVQACLDSWQQLEQYGFARILFDDNSAEHFIRENFGAIYVEAFTKCPHPAMRSDYFRLCYIALNGGVYVDADDAYTGVSLQDSIMGGELILQSLCYDVKSDSMLNPVEYASQADDLNQPRIFYVNNNPLVAAPGHPIVVSALERSTQLLLATLNPRDVQSLTGPGNLSVTVVAHAAQLMREGQPLDFRLHPDWSQIAISQWPLEYRRDTRNWRNWIKRQKDSSMNQSRGDLS